MKALSYQDILLIPKFCFVNSRKNCSTLKKFGPYTFNMPVVPANMLDVIDLKTALLLNEHNIFYIYHRFGDTYGFVNDFKTRTKGPISISVGVRQDSREVLRKLSYLCEHIDYITIDIANAYNKLVANMISHIKKLFPKAFIIAGNVATVDGYNYLALNGADAVKVGIGQGSICTTRLETGFSVPMFTCVLDIFKYRGYKIPIIADGGIQNRGDICKALVAGADMVMCGKLFASCSDSAAKIVRGMKIYRGSTSYEATGDRKHIEGRAIEIETDISYKEQLEKIHDSLTSGISYGGGKDLDVFKTVSWTNL